MINTFNAIYFRCDEDDTFVFEADDPADKKKRRFSFQAFEFPTQPKQTVFVHANVIACSGDTAVDEYKLF